MIDKDKYPILSTIANVAEGIAKFSEGDVILEETSEGSGVTYTFRKTVEEERYICLYQEFNPLQPCYKTKTLVLDRPSKEEALTKLKELHPNKNKYYIEDVMFLCVIKAIV